MQGTIAAGTPEGQNLAKPAEIPEYLIEVREPNANRWPFLRNGITKNQKRTTGNGHPENQSTAGNSRTSEVAGARNPATTDNEQRANAQTGTSGTRTKEKTSGAEETDDIEE